MTTVMAPVESQAVETKVQTSSSVDNPMTDHLTATPPLSATGLLKSKQLKKKQPRPTTSRHPPIRCQRLEAEKELQACLAKMAKMSPSKDDGFGPMLKLLPLLYERCNPSLAQKREKESEIKFFQLVKLSLNMMNDVAQFKQYASVEQSAFTRLIWDPLHWADKQLLGSVHQEITSFRLDKTTKRIQVTTSSTFTATSLFSEVEVILTQIFDKLHATDYGKCLIQAK
jgi:hypothetical protein